ncbi:MAG: hypothetical protein QOE23_2842, partial [Pseudonocardiales bacterium]|nr:hypothetical protein [Pseudonocardiales bacterium]
TPPAPDLAEAVSLPGLPPVQAAPTKSASKAAPARSGPGKAAPATPAKSAAVKATPAKAFPGKAAPAKSAPAKSAPAKAVPAKAAKGGGRKQPDHEPLEVAASKAKPSATPNPATMAAEILQAHEAASDDE